MRTAPVPAEPAPFDDTTIRPSSGNVFTDLGFDAAEAQVLALRVELMAALEKHIKANRMTQVAASKILGVSQGRVSDLSRGKAEKFSLDTLVLFAAKLGKPARLEFVG
jgi:predicted XRE-type DNA-binding protein